MRFSRKSSKNVSFLHREEIYLQKKSLLRNREKILDTCFLGITYVAVTLAGLCVNHHENVNLFTSDGCHSILWQEAVFISTVILWKWNNDKAIWVHSLIYSEKKCYFVMDCLFIVGELFPQKALKIFFCLVVEVFLVGYA